MSLSTLFLDFNAYFASVEQQLRPALRGRPVAVVPMENVDTTCCIAASYEARPFGVRTGTGVAEARRLCPNLILVNARPAIYVRMHHELLGAIDSCLPVHKVLSVDECVCRLLGEERRRERAVALALDVKRAIRERVGEWMRCSIGLAPNRLLAKVASNMQKPDGLTVIEKKDLPDALHRLELTDLPGIARQMERRLYAHGVGSVAELCALSESDMVAVWESVLGRYWHAWLRGEDPPEIPTHRRNFGRQHVLPPELRTSEGARAVLIRLLCSAAAKMRRHNHWAGQLTIFTRSPGGGRWKARATFPHCQDTPSLIRAMTPLWKQRPTGAGAPMLVGVTLHDLRTDESAPAPLFPAEERSRRLSHALDRLHIKHGAELAHPASTLPVRSSAPMRIAFSSIPDLELPQ